jgi:hypothetical protein
MSKGDFLITIAKTISRAIKVIHKVGKSGCPYSNILAIGKPPVFKAIGIAARSKIGS